MFKKLVLPVVFIACMTPTLAGAQDFIMDTSDIGQSHNGVVDSDQILELGSASPNALRLEGESAMRIGHLDRALVLLQRSVELAPGDIDGRILYGEALEQKLMAQKERDPALFNFIVKQWLFIAKKAEFPDQVLQGRSHLINLTGIAPKRMEKEDKFLAKVLLPVDGSTKVAFGKRGTKTVKSDVNFSQKVDPDKFD